jgi:prepilin-type N-terminal cleavage/methylation domain-containing protein
MMKTQRGFTLIEMIVVMTIVALLLGFTTINLMRSQQTASLTSAIEMLVADLRQQQLKSMVGDTEGRAASDSYGIHFDANRYVLFHGTYVDSESTNFVINLASNMQFNSPGFDIIFSKLSGMTSVAAIDLQDNTNFKFKRIHVNNLGVVMDIESL